MSNPIKILNSKWLTLVLVILIFIFSLSVIRINSERLAVGVEIESMEKKIENAKKEQDYLKKTVSFLTDKAFLERQARLKFNYKYSDEEVAFIYPSEAIISNPVDLSRQNLPNYIKWWNFIFNIQ